MTQVCKLKELTKLFVLLEEWLNNSGLSVGLKIALNQTKEVYRDCYLEEEEIIKFRFLTNFDNLVRVIESQEGDQFKSAVWISLLNDIKGELKNERSI